MAVRTWRAVSGHIAFADVGLGAGREEGPCADLRAIFGLQALQKVTHDLLVVGAVLLRGAEQPTHRASKEAPLSGLGLTIGAAQANLGIVINPADGLLECIEPDPSHGWMPPLRPRFREGTSGQSPEKAVQSSSGTAGQVTRSPQRLGCHQDQVTTRPFPAYDGPRTCTGAVKT
jgi:hypothetical protein